MKFKDVAYSGQPFKKKDGETVYVMDDRGFMYSHDLMIPLEPTNRDLEDEWEIA